MKKFLAGFAMRRAARKLAKDPAAMADMVLKGTGDFRLALAVFDMKMAEHYPELHAEHLKVRRAQDPFQTKR